MGLFLHDFCLRCIKLLTSIINQIVLTIFVFCLSHTYPVWTDNGTFANRQKRRFSFLNGLYKVVQSHKLCCSKLISCSEFMTKSITIA
jgi:hypothetical protein